MCGITGILHHPDGPAAIRRMTDHLAHRGSDIWCVYSFPMLTCNPKT